jgi:regulator of replication initiation timing
MQHYLPSDIKSTTKVVKLEMLCKCSGWHLVAHRPSKLAPSALADYAERFAEQHANGVATLEAFDALLELDASTRAAAEAMAARTRALSAIAESDALRRENALLRRRLSLTSTSSSTSTTTATTTNEDEMTTTKAQNDRLQQQLVELKARYRVAKANIKSITKQLQHYEASDTTKKSTSQVDDEQQYFAPSLLTSQKQISQWMNEHPDRNFIFYRRKQNSNSSNSNATTTNPVDNSNNSNDNSDNNEAAIALCVRTAADELVHSKIKRTVDGHYYCVREVCAASIVELLAALQLE